MYGKKKTTARFTRLGLLPRKWFEKKNPHYFWFYRKKKTSVPREKKSRKCITRRVLESFLTGMVFVPKKMWIKLCKRLSRISKTSFCSRVGSIALHYQFLCLTCLKQPLTQFAIKEEFSPWIPSPPKKSLEASSRKVFKIQCYQLLS